MNLPNTGWTNKVGTADRICICGSWKNHWISFSGQAWPADCAVQPCLNPPTLGGHITHPSVTGERIVPMCDACNKLTGTFGLKGGLVLPSANKSQTCEKPV